MSFRSSARTRSRDSRARPLAGADRGGQTLAVETAGGEAGREAEEAQDAQVVLADALIGVADEAHASRGEIVESADGIVDAAVRVRATAR